MSQYKNIYMKKNKLVYEQVSVCKREEEGEGEREERGREGGREGWREGGGERERKRERREGGRQTETEYIKHTELLNV